MTLTEIPELIIDDELYLRRPTIEDIHIRLNYGRPKEFRKMCGGSMFNIPPFTMDDAINWFNQENKQPYSFVIIYNSKMIGVTRLVDQDNQTCRYSIGIFDEKLYNQGIGTRVTQKMIEFSFQVLKFKKVELVVLEFNERAISCYKKCGFSIVGKIKNSIEIDGIFYNDPIMERDTVSIDIQNTNKR